MERVQAAHRLGSVFGDHTVDPFGGVGRHVGQCGGAVRTESGADRERRRTPSRSPCSARRGPRRGGRWRGRRPLSGTAVPLRKATSSIPMRRSPCSGSVPARPSATSRAAIPVTARQETRSNSDTVDAAVRAASHPQVSSNAAVNRDACRAHGACTTVGPCSRQFTRGAAAWISTRMVPKSRCRHRRIPPPRSYHGARRPHCPHRRAAPLRARTVTTSTSPWSPPSSSLISTLSMTTRGSPSSRCHI
jgi:hypothetical protein